MKIGIIGCGQVGTMILTKLIECKEKFAIAKLMVSTRQPHLLKEFSEEYGVDVQFDNIRIAEECDVIFLCALPFQTEMILREIRDTVVDRHHKAKMNEMKSLPLFFSTLAATNVKKLKLLLHEDCQFLRTSINVSSIKLEVSKTFGKKKTIESEEHKEGHELSRPSLRPHNRPTLSAEQGLTPDFLLERASENYISSIEDVFTHCNVYQQVLYSNAIREDNSENSESQREEEEVDNVEFEESILISNFGPDYAEFTDMVEDQDQDVTQIQVQFRTVVSDLLTLNR